MFNTAHAEEAAHRIWEEQILPALKRYIKIQCLSPAFDPNWERSGHIDKALHLIAEWFEGQRNSYLSGQLDIQILRLESRTPLLCIVVPAFGDAPPPGTILLYGHCDKQPQGEGWREGLSAWEPVRDGDRLYGRGGADDGYAAFAALTALRLVQEQGVPHPRCVILIEAREESGSQDLPAYLDHFADFIGQPDLVICLDSSCVDYDHLCLTTSLRGIVMGRLRVDVLTEGVHSGSGGGIIPSSFDIICELLDQIRRKSDGWIKLGALHVDIPDCRVYQAMKVAELRGPAIYDHFPWVEGARPIERDNVTEVLLAQTWQAALEVTGCNGLPSLDKAGNVLRPFTEVMLSMRLPPTVDPEAAAKEMKRALELNPSHGARVSFTPVTTASGWDFPPLAPWLEAAAEAASNAFFGNPVMMIGEGGTIPFMAMLGKKFPRAQFMITGVLGPSANAHGPNEFLHLPTAERVTTSIASIIADFQK